MGILFAGLSGIMMAVMFLLLLGIYTAVLCASIWILSTDDDNPFKQDGFWITVAKCAGLLVVCMVVGLVPLFGLPLALIFWFSGIMQMFDRSFGQAFMIFLANIVINVGVGALLESVLG